jgi:hypothetical protein
VMIKVLIASMTDYQYRSLLGGDTLGGLGACTYARLYVDSISLFMHTSREKLSHAKSHERSFIMRIHSVVYAHACCGLFTSPACEQNIIIHQTFFVKFHVELAHLPV